MCQNPRMATRHLWSGEALRRGDVQATWELLDDVYKCFAAPRRRKRPPVTATATATATATPTAATATKGEPSRDSDAAGAVDAAGATRGNRAGTTAGGATQHGAARAGVRRDSLDSDTAMPLDTRGGGGGSGAGTGPRGRAGKGRERRSGSGEPTQEASNKYRGAGSGAGSGALDVESQAAVRGAYVVSGTHGCCSHTAHSPVRVVSCGVPSAIVGSVVVTR